VGLWIIFIQNRIISGNKHPLIYVVERGLEFDEVSMTHAVRLPPKLEIDADAVSVGQSSTDLTMLLLKLNYSQQIA